MHCPTSQISGLSVHSSISKNVLRKKLVTLRVYYVRSVCASYITITECTGVVEPVTFVARAHVAPERVGAMAVFTKVIVFFALIDVF